MSKLKIGVVGAGGIARRKTMPALRDAANCEITAVMDVAGVEAIAAEVGARKAYTREADLFADPDVEAVYIASPVNLHAAQVTEAARHGKHVLCEKPLARSVAEARPMLEACRRHGVILHEGYMMKFHGAHATIRDLIAAGRLGKLVYMRAQLSCWYPPIPGAWRQDPAQGGGGALLDMATHLYDLLEFFAGPVRRVGAFTGNLVQAYRAEDASTTLLQFESGAQASVDCFFCIPDEASRTRLEIYGSAGSILAEGTVGQSVGGRLEGIFGLGAGGYDAAQTKDVQRVFAPIAFPSVNPYTAEFEHFADCVRNRRSSELGGGEHGLHILALAEAAYAASREGRFIDV